MMVIKNKILKLLTKKEQGSGDITGMLCLTITVFAVLVVLLITAANAGNMRRINNVDAIIRQYALRMETYGCLTDASKSELVNDLTTYGLHDIEISANNTPAQPGETITLDVKGNINWKDYTYDGWVSAAEHNGTQLYHKILSTTAKN